MIQTKNKTCCRCHQLIIVSTAKWVTIQDWNKGEMVGEKHMHIQCWKDMYKEKMKKQIDMITKKLQTIMPNLQGLLPNIENNGI